MYLVTYCAACCACRRGSRGWQARLPLLTTGNASLAFPSYCILAALLPKSMQQGNETCLKAFPRLNQLVFGAVKGCQHACRTHRQNPMPQLLNLLRTMWKALSHLKEPGKLAGTPSAGCFDFRPAQGWPEQPAHHKVHGQYEFVSLQLLRTPTNVRHLPPLESHIFCSCRCCKGQAGHAPVLPSSGDCRSTA